MANCIRKPIRHIFQSQIQDFPKEGARFRVKCHVDAIQWGGVVAECFRDLQKPMRFSGGGGGCSRNFPWSPKTYAIRWGGGSSAEFFFSVTSKRHFPLMGPSYIFLLSRRGARAPWAPLNRPLYSPLSGEFAANIFFTFARIFATV